MTVPPSMPWPRRIVLLIAIWISPVPRLCGAEHATPTAPHETILLFDGRTLDGWTSWLVDTQTADPRRVYTVRDGLVRISGDGYGYLSTQRAFRDYRLVVEYRWGKFNRRERQHNARDSGIFLHSVGPHGNSYDGGGAYKAAIECQVMQGAVGDLLLIKGRDLAGRDVPVQLTARIRDARDADDWPFWDPDGEPLTLRRTGRLNWRNKDPHWNDVLEFRGHEDVESPLEEWTRVECLCRGDSVQVLVNGTMVSEATHVYPRGGKILLQCEGSEVFYRRVEIGPLPP